MKIEIMIYCYGAVCLSMIFFNLFCILSFKNRQSRTLKQSKHFANHIRYRASLIEQGKTLGDKEYKYLVKKLKTVGNLLAFDYSLEKLYKENKKNAEAYIEELHRVFLILSDSYLKKEDVQAAFFLHILNKYEVTRIIKFDTLLGMVKKYFKKPSVYCNLYAMDAISISDSPNQVLDGLKILNDKSAYYDPKVIVRGLLLYKGDRAVLSELLKVNFEEFSVMFKMAIIDYFKYLENENNDFVLQILKDERQNEEIRYRAIRYFTHHKSQPAIDALKDIVKINDHSNWVYVSQAITTLSFYPDAEILEMLKDSLSSPDWYIRYNAAVGLERLGVEYNELADVINGNDRYAREIVTYMAEQKSLRESAEKDKKKEAVTT